MWKSWRLNISTKTSPESVRQRWWHCPVPHCSHYWRCMCSCIRGRVTLPLHSLFDNQEKQRYRSHLPPSWAWAWLMLSVLLFLWIFSRELSRTFCPSFNHFTVGLSPELTWHGMRIRESGWYFVCAIPTRTLISRILGLWGAAVTGAL